MGRNTTDQDTVVPGNVSKVPQLAYDWVVAHHTHICVFIRFCCVFFLGSLKKLVIFQGYQEREDNSYFGFRSLVKMLCDNLLNLIGIGAPLA
jgi:hypothetical protein